jgi:hypothetical protein
VACPRNSSFFTTEAGDKQATDNKDECSDCDCFAHQRTSELGHSESKKQFFSEEKNQKTFMSLSRVHLATHAASFSIAKGWQPVTP